ncbi:DUF3050 domain-containing protein [Silvibacterium acidisoli]|uniref:DUF3050 domain-containing protein n=1 Tax=Acidobacteriaceae bacterium ZG23-2 TaxID=2883246 RepID=UPI00406C15FA
MSQVIADLAPIAAIEQRIAPLRQHLATHPLYSAIDDAAKLRLFMQSHVFAVWDFMSLLKALQNQLTCVTVPWVPSAFPQSRRFINEIVLGEESDVFEGRTVSHFELYLEAMEQSGADTLPVRALLGSLTSKPLKEALQPVPSSARAFVQSTFSLIESGSLHAMAAAFTFGREDIIPEMFRAFVRDLSHRSKDFSIFAWYLERHIEVDGENHGPLSLRMVADLCGTDGRLWNEAAEAAERALQARLALWDSILEEIQQAR